MAEGSIYSDEVLGEFIKNVILYLGAKRYMHCNGIYKHGDDAGIEGDISFSFILDVLPSDKDQCDEDLCDSPFVVPYYSCSDPAKKAKEWLIAIPGLLFCPPSWKEKYTEFTKFVMKMKEESANWSLKIEHCELQKNRIAIFLNREFTFKTIIMNVLQKEHLYGCKAQEKHMGIVINTVQSELDAKNLSQLRLEYLKTFAINVAKLAGYEILKERRSDDDLSICLTNKLPEDKAVNTKVVLCGAVVNAKSKMKETKVLSDEYVKLRINDMKIAAIHKYGLCVTEKEIESRLAIILGIAAVRMELLQGKTSQTVSLDFEPGYRASRENSSKGAVFIQYNYSRISSILKLFTTREEAKVYPALLPLAEIDFSLLQDNDEWTLLRYLAVYPSLMTVVIKEIDDGILKPKDVCNYLNEICKAFSTYYRRIRILKEPRPHLMPVMFARIYLLKALKTVIQSSLHLLGIDIVSQM